MIKSDMINFTLEKRCGDQRALALSHKHTQIDIYLDSERVRDGERVMRREKERREGER